MNFSEDFKQKLKDHGIDHNDVLSISTINDKYKKLIITTVTLNDGTKRKLVEDYVWFSSRKNKRW